MASSMAHQTGFLYGLLGSIILSTIAVLQDAWSQDDAVRFIQDEGVTYSMASTPFLSGLAESSAVEQYDLSSLHIFLSAGAPISRVLVRKAVNRLKLMALSPPPVQKIMQRKSSRPMASLLVKWRSAISVSTTSR